MRYRNTSLKGKNNYYLIKGDDTKSFANNLEELRSVKPYLAANVHGFSDIYEESSKNQAYLIYNEMTGGSSIGCVIIIAPMFPKEPVKLKLYFHEEKFDSERELYNIVDELINLLGRCNYASEEITIELQNDLNLNKWNSFKYQKSQNDWEENTYTCKNPYHQKITASLTEILEVKENLLQSEATNFEEEVVAHPKHFIYPIDNVAITEYRNNRVPFAEIFDKADYYKIRFSLPDNSITEMNHKYNGDVHFENRDFLIDPLFGETNYDGNYNLLTNHLFIHDANNKNITINSDLKKHIISNDNLAIKQAKEAALQEITQQTSITDTNTSIKSEVILNNNEVEKCYFDFRIHKNHNKKVKGTYMLRWIPAKGILSFTYHNRKGMFEMDFTEMIKSSNQELCSELATEHPNLETVDKLISQIITIINHGPYKFEEINLSDEIMSLKKNTIKFLEEIAIDSKSEYLINSINESIKELSSNQKHTNKVIEKTSKKEA